MSRIKQIAMVDSVTNSRESDSLDQTQRQPLVMSNINGVAASCSKYSVHYTKSHPTSALIRILNNELI